MSTTELLAYLLEYNTSISWERIAINLIVTVLLSLFLYFVYRKTYQGVLYQKSFNVTLMMIAVIISFIMMTIGSNLALSLGMVGSLSVIRFRTAVKDPRDMAFLFWAIGVGIACGTGTYLIAILGSIVIAILLYLFGKDIASTEIYLLVLHLSKDAAEAVLEKIVREHTARCNLKMKTVTDAQIDVTYEVRLKKQGSASLSDALRAEQAIKSFSIVAYTGDIAG